jgi:hypothetical protein
MQVGNAVNHEHRGRLVAAAVELGVAKEDLSAGLPFSTG